ncbi:DUF1059 domain-containing protein [Halomicroarcula sp. F13]|uniref:DUF1059 domain-containing protein n=1 Tax=Haloarcula rubra TaxID=2487747 RepID=A0AAW4PL92_9EURY|nr:DUF1059 domain-containing protein [Halomicroarcula rubra]MBX0322313.1 DUF1059 domain-containing protein [Halomicroarcula rubra]
MKRCSHPGCSWRAIAPADDAVWGQYARHLVAEHSTTVDADIPSGIVQLKFEADEDWITVPVEEARALQAERHSD